MDLFQWFINFLIKELLVEPLRLQNKSAIKSENISNKELTEELHKPIIGKFNKRKVHSPFIDNIWGADGADMKLISKLNKEFRFSLCVIYIYHNKYT